MTEAPSYGNREPASEEASSVGEGNQSQDTEPEMLLRRTLWHRGHRYRVHYDELPGEPDIAFPSKKVAVFCDGDFWHGRNWEEQRERLASGNNPDYWIKKIDANRQRDRKRNGQIRERGWTVVRLWESDIKEDPEAAADQVEAALEADS